MVHSDTEQFMPSSVLDCPDCKKSVHVGTGGHKNLDAHRTSKACRTRAKVNQWPGTTRPSKPNQSLHAFFKPQVPLIPSTVTAPPPIHADDQADDASCDALRGALGDAGNKRSISEGPKICPRATQLLQDLAAAAKQIPDEVPMATHEHVLSIFAVDPRTCVAEPGEDDWPILNRMLKAAFGWGEAEMAAAIPDMLNRGASGLDGFVEFMRFFVEGRGLEGALFETKVDALLKELDNR
jgi:hypothetical protein